MLHGLGILASGIVATFAGSKVAPTDQGGQVVPDKVRISGLQDGCQETAGVWENGAVHVHI